MKKLAGVLVALVVVAAVALSVAYLWKKSERKPVVYETEKPFVADIVKKTVATGSVVPRQEVLVKPQVSGIVDTLFVEPGVEVKRGDPIARIAIVPNLVNLNAAETRLNQARIALEDARRELDRHRTLEAEGVVSQALLQEREIGFEKAKEELAAARDHLELIRRGTTARVKDATNTIVRATVGGMVLEVPVEPGSSVIEANTFNDGTTIAAIADMGDLIFKGKVDESEVGKLRPGMELVLTIGALESERFEAALEHIAPKGVEENGAIQFEIRAALRRREGQPFIRANLSANADVVLDRRKQVLAVNESVLQFDDGKPFVEVETAPQTFERRPVETGLSDGIVIEVVSGIGKDDAIKNAAKSAVN